MALFKGARAKDYFSLDYDGEHLKTNTNKALKRTHKAPTSTIFVLVYRLFGNSDLISRKAQNFDKTDRKYFQKKTFFGDE